MQKVVLDSIVVTILNAASQIASFILFAGIAALFGANAQTDAFFLAMTIPALFIGSAVNAITSVFIPVMSACRVQRPQAFGRLIGSALLYVCLFSMIAMGVIAVLAPALVLLMGGHLTGESQRLVTEQMLLLLPMVMTQSITSVLAAIYNSVKRFWAPAAAGGIRYLATLGMIAILQPALGTVSLPLSFVAGTCVQLGILAVGWPRLGLRIHWAWRIEPDLARSFKLALPLILGGAALQFSIVISRFLAVLLPAGSVTMLDYASRISSGIMELLTSGVFLVTLVDWSQVAAEGNLAHLRAKLRQTILMVLFVIMPVVAVLLALRVLVIALVLERGQFDANLTSATSEVMLFFLLAIPFDVMSRAYLRLFLIWQDTWVMGVLATGRLVATTLFSLVLMQVMGVTGLALADSLSIVLVLIGLVILANRRLGNTLVGLGWPLIKLDITALGGGLVAASSNALMTDLSVWIKLPVAIALGCSAYMIIAWLLHVQELNIVLRLISSRWSQ